MKIQLTSIYVNDPIEAFKFYTEILGFKEQMYMPKANLAIVVSPEAEDETALLLEPSDNPIAKDYMTKLYDAGLPPIVFSTEDIQKEYKRLKEIGDMKPFLMIPAGTGFRLHSNKMEAELPEACSVAELRNK